MDDQNSSASPYTLPFHAISHGDIAKVGGKGANLGEMAGAGFPVPGGFCVTTHAYAAFLDALPSSERIFGLLEGLEPDDLERVRQAGAEIRGLLKAAPISPGIREAIRLELEREGPDALYAIRSSATAEDLPEASFAGQQDTYLNVTGLEPVLDAVRSCWASLFTDRAIIYRAKNHFDHREVQLSVVVQHMILPEVSGIMFTANPMTGHRRQIVIEASYGLGEALVSGLVTPDRYVIDLRKDAPVERQINRKLVAIRPIEGGGTQQEEVALEQQERPALEGATNHARATRANDSRPDATERARASGIDDSHPGATEEARVRALAELGQSIQTHYGCPQDIEWAFKDGHFYIVQSRPITSLYPLPDRTAEQTGTRVYICFNHAQVMLDPMTPMAQSFWQTFLPFGREPNSLEPTPILRSAGGRLYADLTSIMLRQPTRTLAPKLISTAIDQLMGKGLARVVENPDFRASHQGTEVAVSTFTLLRFFGGLFSRMSLWLLFRRPESARPLLNPLAERFVADFATDIEGCNSSQQALHQIRRGFANAFQRLFFRFIPAVVPGVLAQKALGSLLEGKAAPTDLEAITRAFTGNVTTDMDLAVGDLGDVARQHPEVRRVLEQMGDGDPRETLARVEGGPDFLSALDSFLEKYGMRCPAEIDIARTRWRDRPDSLLRTVAGSMNREPGSHRARHKELAEEAARAGERLIEAAGGGPFGFLRKRAVRRLLRLARYNFALREHPKFILIRMMDVAREALLDIGQELVDQRRMEDKKDIWYFRLDELPSVLEDNSDLRPLAQRRRKDLKHFEKLFPPRLLTSEGEIPAVAYEHENLPDGAIPGTPVSGGVVEGIARCILDPTREVLNAGEILIAPHTDPGWTPLFINAAALVMEVGGTMTHGSVVAREYGIPAVVGLENATRRIRTGQRIRVDGTRGYVEFVSEEKQA